MVNEPLLLWAREDAGYSLSEASDHAKLYGRTLSVFSLQKPPDLPALASEYRRLPGIKPSSEGGPTSGFGII
jgi:hypothetical protein